MNFIGAHISEHFFCVYGKIVAVIKNMSNSILDTLNENQRKAATTINEHVRIIAGAGSGKTRVLMARIVYLVEDCGIMPNRILAITFTNKAANEMKTRLTAQLGSMASVVRDRKSVV